MFFCTPSDILVDPPGLPAFAALQRDKLLALAGGCSVFTIKKGAQMFICTPFIILLLTRQGSNLDSSEPKSDVLPVTPRVNHFMPFC
jgi:hypothetical protein